MEIIKAENSGFCFGVKRSVDLAKMALESGKKSVLPWPFNSQSPASRRFRKKRLNCH